MSDGETRRWRRRIGWIEVLAVVVLSFVLVFGFIGPFVAEPLRVTEESMTPTLGTDDRVVANKLVYRFAQPERGDVVLFESVGHSEERLIKRIVGLPGDEIEVRNGRVVVNGEPRKEPYLNPGVQNRSFYPSEKVPPGQVFVMGDNRTESEDSRDFGPIPIENLSGEVVFRFWPPGRLGQV